MHDRNNVTAWPCAAERTELTNQHTHINGSPQRLVQSL
jgi:hypothetical protein